MNYEYQETYEFQPEFEYEFEGEQNHEMHENELAHELMGIQNEQELEYFLGNLLKKAWSGAKALYNSPLGQKAKSMAISGLKSFGKQALPGLGSALGGRFFGPTGARIGGQLGNMAVQGLGLEFENSNPSTRRFEGSKRFVRIARIAAKRIVAHAQSGRPLTQKIVRNIILQSARPWFPNFPAPSAGRGAGYQASGYPSNPGRQGRGTWYRQGNQIIIQGL